MCTRLCKFDLLGHLPLSLCRRKPLLFEVICPLASAGPIRIPHKNLSKTETGTSTSGENIGKKTMCIYVLLSAAPGGECAAGEARRTGKNCEGSAGERVFQIFFLRRSLTVSAMWRLHIIRASIWTARAASAWPARILQLRECSDLSGRSLAAPAPLVRVRSQLPSLPH